MTRRLTGNEKCDCFSVSETSIKVKDCFFGWLSKMVDQEHTPEIIVDCLERASEYALEKGICKIDIWGMTESDEFYKVYVRLKKDTAFRIKIKATYKTFLTAGELYLTYINEKTLGQAKAIPRKFFDSQDTFSGHQAKSVFISSKKCDVQETQVDFSRPEKCGQTMPIYCSIKGEAITLDKKNWASLLVAITEFLIKGGFPRLGMLENKPMYGRKPFFMSQKEKGVTCYKVSNGKWIYTNFNPRTIVSIIGNLCGHCGVSLQDVDIRCLPRGTSVKETIPTESTGNLSSNNRAGYLFSPDLLEKTTKIMMEHFSHGFMLNSPIELLRFRRFYIEDFQEEISLEDGQLMGILSSKGTIFDGKIYLVGQKVENEIKRHVDLAFLNGMKVIFYDSFYSRYGEWLFEGKVVSEDMLKNILMKKYPSFVFTGNYFAPSLNGETEFSIIKSEIKRVWGSDIILSYQQLSRRLPYIPIGKIKNVLGQDNYFIWNSTEVYTNLDKVEVYRQESVNIIDYATTEYRSKGYVSLYDIPFGEIAQRHYELSFNAIQNAVFAIVLSDKFDKRGKIITLKGNVLDSLTVIKEQCRELDKCTLGELLDLGVELTGAKHHGIALEAGNSIMVRIDKDNFVSERYVNFDIEAIDETLYSVVIGDYLPLKSILTFAAFPHCGQVWNLFLLESYCRRFSTAFRFEAPGFNSKNAGVILRSNCSLTYHQIMADAVGDTNVKLEEKAVQDFLFKQGYLGRRSYAKINDLIEQARVIRIGGN